MIECLETIDLWTVSKYDEPSVVLINFKHICSTYKT